jgi:predicted ATPase/DNA-binding SARP family transcriptional activator/DNA-binding CsgD family transcriptional regulator
MCPAAGSKRVTQSGVPTGMKPEAVRIWLLGGFRVSVGTRTIEGDEWRLRKAAALVKVLCMAPGHRLHREQVMDLLWPEANRRAASNNLRTTLHAARKVLDPAMGALYLASEEESLVLCPGGSLWVDVEAFEENALTARRSREPAAYRVAIELYVGELLPDDRYEEWTEGRREELRQLHLMLLMELAGLYEERDEFRLAIEVLRKATATEPTFEEGHVGLMRLHAVLGHPERSLAQYERLRDALYKVLGTKPAATTRRLRDEIALGSLPMTPSAADSLQEEKPAGVGKHNLPAPRTSFVGREREMVEVKRTLAMTRLLTLTGAGGSGKTRLGLEVARDLIGAYPDGVWFVELAPLSEPDLVAQEVAGTLEVPERPGEPLTDTLIAAMGDKGLLLILDNCEHLVEGAARLVDTLLDSCPHLRVLATSREALGVGGEVLWQVAPLSLPATTDGGPNGRFAVEGLMRYEAVKLFVDRARLKLPDFELTQGNAQAVARVCKKLEGIPLAIELATARMGTLAVEQVAQRLDASLGLLTSGSRTAEPRQRTLRATLDWSYDLLSNVERELFKRLSVFAGGWTLEAAEGACSGGSIEREDILDLLGGLVDKSLVVAGASSGGAMRYRMLEPIRQYASERLEERGDAEAIERAHAEYFLALAEEAEPMLWGADDAKWLDTLEEEHDNMRAALSWAISHEEVELALRLGGALRWFWYMRGYYGEGRTWLEEALAKDPQASPETRAKALIGVGWLAHEQGDIDRTETAAEEGLQLSEEAGLGGVAVAEFRHILGEVASQRGDHERAEELLEESLALYREAGDRRGAAWTLGNLANASGDRGDHEGAQVLYEQGLALARELGGARLLSTYLIGLGYEFLLQGDFERATELNEEAAKLHREQGSKGGLQYALDNLGWAALVRGDHQRARALHEESLELCKELGDKLIAGESLEGLACAAGARREGERAARLFGAARALREAIGYQQVLRERALREPYLAAVHSQLGEAAWEEALSEGRAMSLEYAADYALSGEKPDPLATPVTEVIPDDEPPTSLTRREEEVAAQVAQGLTNHQIASHLMLSEHTVATHIRNILKKLGLHSRTEIAAYVREQR